MIRPYLAKINSSNFAPERIIVLINAETIEEAEKTLTIQSIYSHKKWQVEWIKPLLNICDGKHDVFLLDIPINKL